MPFDPPPSRLASYRGSFMQGRVANALQQVKACIAYLHDVQEMDLAAALHGLAAAKQLRRFVYSLEESFEIAALAEMESGNHDSYAGPGFTATVRTEGRRKEWQSESLVNELADRFVAETKGEYPGLAEADLRTITLKAMDKVVAAGRTQWRSGSLKQMGVDPDEFSTKAPGLPTAIELTGPATYAEMSDFGVERNGL